MNVILYCSAIEEAPVGVDREKGILTPLAGATHGVGPVTIECNKGFFTVGKEYNLQNFEWPANMEAKAEGPGEGVPDSPEEA